MSVRHKRDRLVDSLTMLFVTQHHDHCIQSPGFMFCKLLVKRLRLGVGDFVQAGAESLLFEFIVSFQVNESATVTQVIQRGEIPVAPTRVDVAAPQWRRQIFWAQHDGQTQGWNAINLWLPGADRVDRNCT